MVKPKTTTTIYPLFIATVLLAALPHTTGQSPAIPPMSAEAPGGGASTTAPSPGPDCFTSLIKLSDCLTFVEDGSNLTKPDTGCCPEVSNLITTSPVCLCELLANPGQVGIPVDINKALKLPSVCQLSSTPPVSLCALIGVPVAVPGPSEAPSPVVVGGGGPEAAGPSGGSISSSPESPSPASEGNGSPSNLASSPHFLVGVALILFTSFL